MKRWAGALLFLGVCVGVAGAGESGATASAGIDAFNRALTEATANMDNAATVALWDEDGISLLPSTKPIIGKKAIARFLADVTASIPGARMAKFEMQCFDIELSGNWASEWCAEHQVVVLPEGKPPFEGWGNMLLVLHRGSDGKWRLKREMWQEASKPSQPTVNP
jgi:ketosteroid isomerase-like protein